MALRLLTATLLAVVLGMAVAPALARPVHVMGLTIEQPDRSPHEEVRSTGSVRAPHTLDGDRTRGDRTARQTAKTR